MEFSEIVQRRYSVKSYDPEKTISDAELRGLFDEVVLSPSSYNLQHWTFIAVREPDLKKQLKEAAWGQSQMEECSVAVLVCGKLDAYKDAPEIYKEAPSEIQKKNVAYDSKFLRRQTSGATRRSHSQCLAGVDDVDVRRHQSRMGDGPDDRVRSGSGCNYSKADLQPHSCHVCRAGTPERCPPTKKPPSSGGGGGASEHPRWTGTQWSVKSSFRPPIILGV